MTHVWWCNDVCYLLVQIYRWKMKELTNRGRGRGEGKKGKLGVHLQRSLTRWCWAPLLDFSHIVYCLSVHVHLSVCVNLWKAVGSLMAYFKGNLRVHAIYTYWHASHLVVILTVELLQFISRSLQYTVWQNNQYYLLLWWRHFDSNTVIGLCLIFVWTPRMENLMSFRRILS